MFISYNSKMPHGCGLVDLIIVPEKKFHVQKKTWRTNIDCKFFSIQQIYIMQIV